MGSFAASLFRSFRTKVLMPVVLIMVGLLVVTAWLINERITSQFKEDAARDLSTADAVFKSLQSIRTRNLLARFSALPNEPRYKATFQTGDGPTLRELLKDVVLEHDVDVVLFAKPEGTILSHHKRNPSIGMSEFAAASERAIQNALRGEECVDTVHVGEAIFDVIAVVVRGVGDAPLGVLTIGTEMGETQAQEFSLLTQSEIALLAGGEVVVSTLSSQDSPALATIENAQVTPLVVREEHYYASAGHFRSLSGNQGLSYVILSSYEQPLRALRSTQQTIAMVSLIGILIGGAILTFFVQRVAKPLEKLHDSVEAVGRGDLSQRIELHSNDEFEHLAMVFNRMVENLKHSRAELENTLESLRSTQSQLIQSEKLSGIGEFVAGVAHELNNPLTTVIGFSEILQSGTPPPKAAQQLNRILSSAKRCQKIVQSLLSFARHHQPEIANINLNDITREAVEFLDYQMRTSNIRVTLDLQHDLPSSMGDAHQIHQVLVNILNNARQAIEEHQASGTLRVKTNASTGVVRCIIQDNGPGIPEACLARIFDPFFTTKEVGKGTGLGLSMCFGIVKEHGGTISVSSQTGQGATFVVELPASKQTLTSPDIAATNSHAHSTLNGAGRRILVVDDEEGILEMMDSILTINGFRVDTAADGHTALDRLRVNDYEATLCDWRMPGMSGREIFEHLKQDMPEKAGRMIFMTGDVANPTTRDFIENNRCPVISKPFTIAEFQSTFRRVVEKQEATEFLRKP